MSLITAPYQVGPACRLLPLAVGLVVGLHSAPVFAETGSAWQAGNRGLSVSLDSLNRRYMEFDSQKLTPDGILDAEQGMLRGGAIRARWQGRLFGRERWPVQLQGEYRLYTGSTDYQGYLQSGGVLTPYSALTGNELNDFRLRAGLPITQSACIQWVPFVEYRYQHWLRDLAQYRETFQHHAGVVGLLVQWQASQRWLLEVEAGYGAILHAQIDVPQLGFSGTLGEEPLWTWGASASYAITNQWHAVARMQKEQFRYAQSAASNGFVEPESFTKQTSMQLGIEYRY